MSPVILTAVLWHPIVILLSADEGVDVSGRTITTTCTLDHSCSYTVTASALVGEATCTATITVYPEVATEDFRIVALDAQNNKTLIASRVVVQLRDGSLDAKNTGTDGSYTWEGKAGDVTAISLFDNDYHWQTVIAPDSNDIVVFTRPVPEPTKATGVKGRFNYDNVQSLGEVKMAIAGTPINGDLTALDFDLVLGENCQCAC